MRLPRSGAKTFDHNRSVEMRLIAQLITAPQDSPPLTVRQLLKPARAAGFKRDSGCPRHPENITLYNGPPITVLLRAYVTAERTIAILAAESYRNGRRPGGSPPGTELLARLLAWPTKDAAAQFIGDPDETIADSSGAVTAGRDEVPQTPVCGSELIYGEALEKMSRTSTSRAVLIAVLCSLAAAGCTTVGSTTTTSTSPPSTRTPRATGATTATAGRPPAPAPAPALAATSHTRCAERQYTAKAFCYLSKAGTRNSMIDADCGPLLAKDLRDAGHACLTHIESYEKFLQGARSDLRLQDLASVPANLREPASWLARAVRDDLGIRTGGGTAFAGDAIELVADKLEMTNPRRPRFVYVLSDGVRQEGI